VMGPKVMGPKVMGPKVMGPKVMGPPLGGGPIYTKESSVPWGGLGGYPFTPWTNVP